MTLLVNFVHCLMNKWSAMFGSQLYYHPQVTDSGKCAYSDWSLRRNCSHPLVQWLRKVLTRIHQSMCIFHTRLETEQDFKHCAPNSVRQWIKSERRVFLNCTFILFRTFVSDMNIYLDFCTIIFPPPSWKALTHHTSRSQSYSR